jgi:hypothetical protein
MHRAGSSVEDTAQYSENVAKCYSECEHIGRRGRYATQVSAHASKCHLHMMMLYVFTELHAHLMHLRHTRFRRRVLKCATVNGEIVTAIMWRLDTTLMRRSVRSRLLQVNWRIVVGLQCNVQ